MSITVNDLLDNLWRDLRNPDLASDAPYNAYIADAIQRYWQQHVDKDSIAPGLRIAYTRRDVIDALLAQAARQVDTFVAGSTGSRGIERLSSQQFEHLVMLRNLAVEEITRIANSLGSRRPGAIVAMTATAPREVPSYTAVDANARRFRGDPYEA